MASAFGITAPLGPRFLDAGSRASDIVVLLDQWSIPELDRSCVVVQVPGAVHNLRRGDVPDRNRQGQCLPESGGVLRLVEGLGLKQVERSHRTRDELVEQLAQFLCAGNDAVELRLGLLHLGYRNIDSR